MPLDGAHIQGKNFAPVEPLTKLKKTAKDSKENSSNLAAFLRQKGEHIESQFEEEWREQTDQARMIFNLLSGKLVMKNDLHGQGVVFLQPLPNARRDRSNFPLFPQNFETLKAKWRKSSPLIRVESWGDGYRSEIAMDEVNTVVKYYFRRIFNGMYELNEANDALGFGTYITQLFYDDKLNQIRQAVPIIKNESKVVLPGYGACHDCGFEGNPTDFAKTGAAMPQCPECESYRTTKMVEDTMAEVPKVVGADEIVQGDITGRLLPFSSVRYDPHFTPHESPYFRLSEYVPLRMVRSMFGDQYEIHESESDDYGLNVLDHLAARGGNTEGLGENVHYGNDGVLNNRVPMRTVWLKPEEYIGFKLPTPEKTISGTIPADVPFEEIFPKGLCYTSTEDYRVISGVFAEEVHLASASYFIQPHSGIGKGISDAADIQKDLNELHSMAMAGLKRFGASGIVIDKKAGLTHENVRDLFKPNKAVFAEIGEHGIDDIKKAVMQLDLNPVNQVLPQFTIALSNLMNMAFMNSDFTAGMVQDVDIDTLGGQELAHAKTEEGRGGILTGKVSHRILSAKAIITLFRQHIKLPMWLSKGDASERQGRQKTVFLSGMKIPTCDLTFEAVPDSELPSNQYEKRVAAREMIEKGGGLPALIQAVQLDPKMTGWYTQQFGVELPMLDSNELQLVCLARVDQIKELAQVFGDPESILMNLTKKLQVREQQHLLKAEFVAEILDDDEAIEWDPLVRATVELLIERHYELEGEAQARNQIIASTAMAKAQAAAQQIAMQAQQPMIDQQRAMQQEDEANAMGAELANKIIEDEAAGVQHEREMEKIEAQDRMAANRESASDGRAAQRESDADMRSLDIKKAEAKMQPKPQSKPKGK